MRPRQGVTGILWLAAYAACIVGANWALARWGIVAIGFGLMAPAGVYFAGLALTARDGVRQTLGPRWMLLAVLLGAGLSALLEDAQRFALASGIAFGLSELADAAVFEPLRRRWSLAVLISGIVGLTVDSILFLWLAFGSLEFIEGQLVGKLLATIAAVGVMASVAEGHDLLKRLYPSRATASASRLVRDAEHG